MRRRQREQINQAAALVGVSPEMADSYSWPELVDMLRPDALAKLAELGDVNPKTLTASIITPSARPILADPAIPSHHWFIRFIADVTPHTAGHRGVKSGAPQVEATEDEEA
jgi:predicted secreted Zn-dependent protease